MYMVNLDFAEENEAPNSWYWSFRLAAEHGYIDLSNNEEILHACDYDPPDDYLTGGDGVNGTDDGGMDDLSNTDFPYSSIPPGEQFDTPYQLNQTQKNIVDGWDEKKKVGENENDNDSSPKDALTSSFQDKPLVDGNMQFTGVHMIFVAVCSFVIGFLVQRSILLTSSKSYSPPSSSTAPLPLFYLPELATVQSRGSYQQIDEGNNEKL